MEYKKNKMKFPLAFKKKVGEAAVANKWKLEAEKPADVWNAKKTQMDKTKLSNLVESNDSTRIVF